MPNNNDKEYYSQKYSQMGSQIRDTVMDAINSGNYSGLSETIRDSVNMGLNEVGDQFRNIFNGQPGQPGHPGYVKPAQYREVYDSKEAPTNPVRQKMAEYEKRAQLNRDQRGTKVKRPQRLVRFNDVGSVSGTLSVVGGFTGAGLGFLGTIGALASATAFTVGPLIVGGIIMLISAFAVYSGIAKLKLLEVARKYKKLCSEQMYVGIDTLASATGMSQKKTIKKVKKILEKGFFPEGYIDAEETTLMVSKDVYNQYIETKNERFRIAQEELEAAAKGELTPGQQSELNTMISEGNKAITRLQELNADIPGESITRKLNESEILLKDIFNRVKEHPEQMKNCHKLMEYYLPTMIKLVESYKEFDSVAAPGSDIVKAKAEIEKTLETINQGFTQLLNNLFRDSAWNATADAKVLKSMLEQEGLAENK